MDDALSTLRAVGRRALSEIDRPTLLLLVLAACMPVVYVYQGVPAFYLAHLADPADHMGPIHAQYWRFSSVFVLFFVVPAAAWRLVARRPLSEIGLCLGDWRAGMKIVAVALLAVLPLLWASAGMPDMQAEYPLEKRATRNLPLLVCYEAAYALYYWGWEALFRGALQLGLRRKLGVTGACMVQLLPSVLLHIGKPIGETWAAVVAAPLFGAVAVRTRSFLPVFVFHYAIGVLNDVLCTIRQGLTVVR